jgi:hypothetical protein
MFGGVSPLRWADQPKKKTHPWEKLFFFLFEASHVNKHQEIER